MMKVVFVILHYLTAGETIECIQSLLNHQLQKQDAIVIVDNGSKNGSFEQVKNKYPNNKQLYWRELPQNLGFAQGNNVGFQFAKHQLQADLIILLNNDTEINQIDFRTRLEQIYQTTPFDVLGPDIITLDGQHQNPKSTTGLSNEKLRQRIHLTQFNLVLNSLGLYNVLILIDRIKNRFNQPSFVHAPATNKKHQTQDVSVSQKRNVVLHGSCLIFSADYIKRFRGLFSQTFLYVEEEILWQIAQHEGLRLVYEPSLQILHKEDRSTRVSQKSTHRRRSFKLKHELHGLKLLDRISKNSSVYQQDLNDDNSILSGGSNVSD